MRWSTLIASVFLLSVGCASARVHITTPEGRVYKIGARAILWGEDHVTVPAIVPKNETWNEYGFGSGMDLRLAEEDEGGL